MTLRMIPMGEMNFQSKLTDNNMSTQNNLKTPAEGGRIFGNELNYVREVLAEEFRTSSGATMMRRLEEAFAAKFGSAYAISHVNGTATMHSVLEAAGIGPGDEVIVPP
jgi:dTDP-4-amino-4,6-dideoxygalactose transaminase